jgi:hypothetical protein
MSFRKITDELFVSINHDEFAKALGVSVATVRQARLGEESKAHRSAPPGWKTIALRLAEDQARHFRRLAERLRRASDIA